MVRWSLKRRLKSKVIASNEGQSNLFTVIARTKGRSNLSIFYLIICITSINEITSSCLLRNDERYYGLRFKTSIRNLLTVIARNEGRSNLSIVYLIICITLIDEIASAFTPRHLAHSLKMYTIHFLYALSRNDERYYVCVKTSLRIC